MYCARLAQRFPAVRVEPDPIFVCDGPVWTSAGVTAGIDLGLALVEEDLGRSMALAVARYLVVFLKRPGGQAQFSAALALQAADDKFGALHDWINAHLSDDLSLSVLADQAGMSERSFSRHYAEATGQTPARAIERLRVEAAQRLLSESRTPVKRIAQRSGFDAEETLRRSFLRLLAVTPQRLPRSVHVLNRAVCFRSVEALRRSAGISLDDKEGVRSRTCRALRLAIDFGTPFLAHPVRSAHGRFLALFAPSGKGRKRTAKVA